MKPKIWIISLALIGFFLSCGDSKKQEAKKDPGVEKSATAKENAETSESTSEDLVYEGVGISTLKMESTARSQAELKGRVELIKALHADAVFLIREFSKLQKDLFSDRMESETFEKKLNEYFNNETIQLKGSSVSEYRRSEKGDTTFADMEMPLTAGYDVIETAIVSVGLTSGYIQSGAVDNFKKSFRDFFMAEKKKLLTKPA